MAVYLSKMAATMVGPSPGTVWVVYGPRQKLREKCQKDVKHQHNIQGVDSSIC